MRYGFQYAGAGGAGKVLARVEQYAQGQLLEFDIAVYNSDDKLMTGLSQTLTMPLSDSTYQQMLVKRTPLRFSQQIDLPMGQLFVRVGVLDPATEKYGTLELPLHVGRKGTEASAPPAAEKPLD